MATAVDKIAARVAAYDGPGSDSPAVGAYLAPSDIQTLHSEIDAKATAFGKRLDQLAADVDRGAQGIAEKWKATTSLARHVRDAAAAKEAEAHRREVIRNSEGDRVAKLRELVAEDRVLAAQETHYPNATAMLDSLTLASAERATLTANLATAGANAVTNAARNAMGIMTNPEAKESDKAAARAKLAAVLSRLESMTPSERKQVSFSRQAIADAGAGPEFRTVRGHIADARAKIQRSINAEREFTRGKKNPLNRVADALAKKRNAADFGE